MVRTRFAPSPTGLLHIGGARTALFNYLFARHCGGQFLLRIEDTDRARSTEQAVRVILEGLDWLGLHADEEPVFQSTRHVRHREVAEALLASGAAYRAYDTAEELAEMRARAEVERRPIRYDGRWRDRDPADAPSGVAPVVRLKAPGEGQTVVHDLVQGNVRVANAELDDMIILRSDGTPTYLHAVVVDDHDMGITHVIRGDDHLTNTFRQLMVYRGMGWEPPQFAHLPLIHGADGAKLSKRHGAVSVLEFREQGYLPEALSNYLLRLGWGHGDIEVIGRDEAIALFDIKDVGRAAARMDYAKLTYINGVWLRAADDDWLTAEVLQRLGPSVTDTAALRIRQLMPALKERAKTLVELAKSAEFLANRRSLPFVVEQEQPPHPGPFVRSGPATGQNVREPKAAALLTDEAKAMLRDLAELLAGTPFEEEALDAALRGFADRTGRKLGQVAQPLRAALTGSTTSPPIDATLAALGRDEALARINSAVA